MHVQRIYNEDEKQNQKIKDSEKAGFNMRDKAKIYAMQEKKKGSKGVFM